MNLETFVANGRAAQAAANSAIADHYAKQEPKFRSFNPAPFLCQSAVRKFLLEMAAKERPFHKFTRVSGQTILRLNEIVRTAAIGHVKQLPSKGRTI